jgi:uncharacterized protein YjaZ
MLTIKFSDEAFESAYIPVIQDAHNEAVKLLKNLQSDLTIEFKNNGASEETGVGGFSMSPHQLNVAVYRSFPDIATQQRNLRAVVFHELYHMNQGFTYEQSPFTALQAAVFEGCAVTFEREYGGGEAAYADYSPHSDEELTDWLNQLKQVGLKYFEDTDTWLKWAQYHPELDQKWIIYKAGMWLIKRILDKNHLSILDLQDKTPDEILRLNT